MKKKCGNSKNLENQFLTFTKRKDCKERKVIEKIKTYFLKNGLCNHWNLLIVPTLQSINSSKPLIFAEYGE